MYMNVGSFYMVYVIFCHQPFFFIFKHCRKIWGVCFLYFVLIEILKEMVTNKGGNQASSLSPPLFYFH